VVLSSNNIPDTKGINGYFRDRSFSKLLEYYFGKKNLVFLNMELPGYHSSRVFS
jgi:hypothetical protein